MTSLPPHAPVTAADPATSTANGALVTPKAPGASKSSGNSAGGHGEVDASSSSLFCPPATDNRPNLRDVCRDIHGRVERFLAIPDDGGVIKRTQEQMRISLGVVDKALREYGVNHLSLSYNGGKDCLVLLVLYLSVLHTHFEGLLEGRETKDDDGTETIPTKLASIYAKPPDPFPAVSTFVESSSRRYCLDLTHISTNPGPLPSSSSSHHQKSHTSPNPPPHNPSNLHAHPNPADPPDSQPIITFRDAFFLYLQTHPSIHAIFVGTRRTDPHGSHLTHFDMTDGTWPRFMRIHPVIDWHLDEIWCFLRHPLLGEGRGKEGEKEEGGNKGGKEESKKGLEYCSMYDEGYTSLGGRGDTVRNPRLKVVESQKGEGEIERWRPAYEMVEDGAERAGRE